MEDLKQILQILALVILILLMSHTMAASSTPMHIDRLPEGIVKAESQNDLDRLENRGYDCIRRRGEYFCLPEDAQEGDRVYEGPLPGLTPIEDILE